MFFISPTSDVKEDVLRYYEINKAAPSVTSNPANNYKSQLKAISEDFFERLDSRGKMIKIRRLHPQQEMLGSTILTDDIDILGYPYSTFNMHPLSFITQHELKARASSLAFSRYKLKKREVANIKAKRKRLLLIIVVLCLRFVKNLKANWAKKKIDREAMKIVNERKKKKFEEQKKFEKLTRETNIDDSGLVSQSMMSATNNNNNGLIASESVGSLLTLNNQANVSLMIFAQQKKQLDEQFRGGSFKHPGVGLLGSQSAKNNEETSLRSKNNNPPLPSPNFQNVTANALSGNKAKQ